MPSGQTLVLDQESFGLTWHWVSCGKITVNVRNGVHFPGYRSIKVTFLRYLKRKNPELTIPVNEVAKILCKWHDHRKIQLKLPYCPVACDVVHCLATTERIGFTVQEGYEFRNDVYVDGWSFYWTSLKSGFHICYFRFHYERFTRSLH
ncbi:hypothetical protein TNCV_3790431 [Trichonephila clavipes]|nr:hypothetical protein TNCV_3790431 [Trichonephila clavipes]